MITTRLLRQTARSHYFRTSAFYKNLAGRPATFRYIQQASDSNKKKFRLCIFDVSDRIFFHEGHLIEKMFSSAFAGSNTTIESDIYAIKYDHWPIHDNQMTLLLVDEYLRKYKTEKEKGIVSAPLIPPEKVPSVENIFSFLQANYDAVAISGSDDSCMNDKELPYLKILIPLLKQSITEHDYPFFGICFGAQAIARAIWGDKRMSTMIHEKKEPEYGYIKYQVIKPEVKFLEHVPREFVSSSYHRDCFVLDEALHLISSRNWENQAFQVPNRRTFGVQFHPEFPKEMQDELLRELEQVDHTAVVSRDGQPNMEVGKSMARNFVEICSINGNK